MFFVCVFFFKINFFKILFLEHYNQSAKLCGSISAGSKLFAKVISRRQKLRLARKWTLYLCMLGNFTCLNYLSSVELFKTTFLKKTSFRNTIRVSNSLDPDHCHAWSGAKLLQLVYQQTTDVVSSMHLKSKLLCTAADIYFLTSLFLGRLNFKLDISYESVTDPEGVPGFSRIPLCDKIVSISWRIFRKIWKKNNKFLDQLKIVLTNRTPFVNLNSLPRNPGSAPVNCRS